MTCKYNITGLKKGNINILIVFMALSLMGIVVVQIIWIRQAVAIRNEQFDNTVKKVMSESAEKIETLDYVRFFAHGDISPPPPPPVPTQEYMDSLVNVVKNKIPDTIATSFFGDRPKSSDNSEHIIHIDRNQILIEKRDSFRNITFRKKKVTNEELNNVEPDSNNKKTPETSYFEHSIEINDNEARHVIIERLKGKEKKINWVARKMVDEILITDEKREIPFDGLHELLIKGFNENKIETNAIFALIQDDSITASSKAINDSSLFLQSPYLTQLYPNDIFLKNAYISATFPDKRTFLYKSMAGMLIASLIFSFFILTAFWLSIHFILKQKKISDVKSDFINNMTHEFKTPIATIGVAVDTLTNEKVIGNKEMLKEYAGIIKAENQRMNGHVEKILSVARMEHRETEFKFAPVNVHALLEELTENLRLRTESSNGRIELDLQAENPFVAADATHLYNAMQNIFDNAIKYSPDSPYIKVCSKGESQFILLSVIDHGMGMSKQVQSKIFETFYRQPTGNIHNIKGFGLGLSYVKTVIEMHHGRIDVKSKPGEGSTFTIYLPYDHG